MKKLLLLTIGLWTLDSGLWTLKAQPLLKNFATTNAPDAATNFVRSLATNVFDANIGTAGRSNAAAFLTPDQGTNVAAYQALLATNNYAPTVTGIVNAASLYFDADAAAYGAAHGVTNYTDLFRLSAFVRTLKQGGVWTQTGFGMLLRSNLNHVNLTNAQPWVGGTSAVYGTPTYNAAGLTLGYGTGDGLFVRDVPDLRTNTVFIQGSITYSNWVQGSKALLTLKNANQLTDDFTGSYFAFGTFENEGLLWRAANAAGGGDAKKAYMYDYDRLRGFGGSTKLLASERTRIYVGSMSNTTVQGWVENIPAGLSGGVYNQTPVLELSGTPTALTQPLTNMIIGGACNGSGGIFSFPATFSLIWILTNAPTQAVVDCVNRALRCLDPQADDLLFIGESRFAGISFSAAGDVGDQRNTYVNQLTSRLGSEGSARVFNFSAPGIKVAEQLDDTNFLRTVGFHQPDGILVKNSEAHLNAGIYNQFAGGTTVAATFQLVSNLCSKIRGRGYRLNLYTEAPIAYLGYETNSGGTYWTNFAAEINTLLITNRYLYDRLIRYDLFFTDAERMTNSGYYTDGIHPNAAGNRRWADETARQLSGAYNVATWNENGVALTNLDAANLASGTLDAARLPPLTNTVEYLRSSSFILAGGGATVLNHSTASPAPIYSPEGIILNNSGAAGTIELSVPNWVTQAVASCWIQAGDVFTWTNTVSGWYYLTNNRITPTATALTFSADATTARPWSFTNTWPATNEISKHIRVQVGARSNAAAVYFLGPWQMSYR